FNHPRRITATNMGVTGLWQKLKSKGLDPQPISPSALEDVFYDVDLQGCFFSVLKTMFEESYDKPGAAYRVGHRLAHKIKATFGEAALRLHVDGGPAEEKAYAAAKRSNTRRADQVVLDKELTKMKEKSEQGKWTCATTMEVISRSISKMFVLTAADKAGLRDGLEAGGVRVCLCETEADVCIARGPDQASADGCRRQRVAVSVDSDLLIYDSITAVLRPMPRQSGYGLYLKPDVLHALDFPTSRHLLLYGIISENDYGRNVEQLGLARNADIIRTLPSEDLADMLASYSRKASTATGEAIDPHRFHLAHRVFGDHKQRLLDGPSLTNDVYRSYRQRFDQLKNLRLTTKPGPST
ncbi:hypothetical protein BGZ75_001631, partial [Mortierella antarctica]